MKQPQDGRGFLRDKMEAYRVHPPDEVWTGIASQLGGGGRRRMLVIALATAATIALAVTIGVNFSGPDVTERTASGDAINEVADLNSGTLSAADPAKTSPPGDAGIDQPVKAGKLEARVAEVMKAVDTPDAAPAAKVLADLEMPPVQEFPVPVEESDFPWPDAADARVPEPRILQDSNEQGPEVKIGVLDTRLPESDPAALEPSMIDPPLQPLESEKGHGGLVLGAAVSPLYSFRDAEAQYIDPGQPGESGTVAYAGGVQVGYRTSGRLAFETGVYFNKMGIDVGARSMPVMSGELDLAPIVTEGNSMSRVVALSNTVGNIVSESGDIYVNNYLVESKRDVAYNETDMVAGWDAEQGIRQHLEYLEIPFNVRYTVVDRSIQVHLLGGMSTNVLVNNYVSMETAEGPREIGYMTNLRNVNYSGNAGIGFSYLFLESFRFSLEPRFRYFLNSVNDESLPSTRPYTFGLYTGFSYLF